MFHRVNFSVVIIVNKIEKDDNGNIYIYIYIGKINEIGQVNFCIQNSSNVNGGS